MEKLDTKGNVSRKEALKKIGYGAFTASTMMFILSGSAKAGNDDWGNWDDINEENASKIRLKGGSKEDSKSSKKHTSWSSKSSNGDCGCSASGGSKGSNCSSSGSKSSKGSKSSSGCDGIASITLVSTDGNNDTASGSWDSKTDRKDNNLPKQDNNQIVVSDNGEEIPVHISCSVTYIAGSSTIMSNNNVEFLVTSVNEHTK